MPKLTKKRLVELKRRCWRLSDISPPRKAVLTAENALALIEALEQAVAERDALLAIKEAAKVAKDAERRLDGPNNGRAAGEN